MNDFKSTDDKRTENSGTRSKYRTLTEAEKASIDEIKLKGDQFLSDLSYCASVNPDAAREFALSRTHLEGAVMRAVRGITQ